MDFISAQVDQIDTGKEVSLSHYLPSAMFLKLKYQEKGTMSNVSQRFVKALNVSPHFFFHPLLSKAAVRGIYTGGIVRSFLNFPYSTPVSMPESITYRKGGFPEASPRSSPGPCAVISAAALLLVILLF